MRPRVDARLSGRPMGDIPQTGSEASVPALARSASASEACCSTDDAPLVFRHLLQRPVLGLLTLLSGKDGILLG